MLELIPTLKEKNKCWWCGSKDLTGEHKFKKTELELLYGTSYPKDNKIGLIKHRTDKKPMFIQGSGANGLKFSPVICSKCNNSISQPFDKAYSSLIDYYYKNRIEIIRSGRLNFEIIFGESWQEKQANIYRYITKHIGCRIAELGFSLSPGLIDFLNGTTNYACDLKVVFQLKPYDFKIDGESLEFIFMGPITPINSSPVKGKDFVTSFSGWYTFCNFSWNYLYELNINNSQKICFEKEITLNVVEFSDDKVLEIKGNVDTFEQDFGKGLERIEYHPFKGENKEIEHCRFLKYF